MKDYNASRILCDWDEAFTCREMYEETNFCISCYKLDCPYHIKAVADVYETNDLEGMSFKNV